MQAAPVQFAPAFVVPLVGAFIQHYPDMEVELTASDRFVDLWLVVFGSPACFARARLFADFAAEHLPSLEPGVRD